MPLEVVRAAPLLAPAEVKDLEPVLHAVAEEAPVHEIVHRVTELLASRAAIIRKHRAAVEERENRGDRVPLAADEQDAAVGAELREQVGEQGSRKDRCPEVSHAVRVKGVERI